jgi:hypothetical protein
MLDHAVDEMFLRPEHRKMLLVEMDVASLLKALESYTPVTAPKWIEGLKAGKI